ncbi:phage tail protein [Zobellella iuensis]|uniref:Phage tail protein n=1 Tax=Zobellella iuensis TaxID=2803811 RepID=A0ABS1QT93_9GAMM|nr:tail fiber protein [Zobellella iuensis]MBL1378087.1 phage tail protein [Zobellella iuensis]
MDPFIGEIKLVGFNFEPRGWAFCDGRLLPIAQNEALFSLLGTIYGGDGRSTFALPDLRGRSPVGMGTGTGLNPVNLGQKSGQETVTLTNAQMPAHSHTISVAGSVSEPVNAPTPANNVLGASGGGQGSATIWSNSLSNPVAMSPEQVGTAGSSQPVNIRNPYLGSNYIIALQGIYPTRA